MGCTAGCFAIDGAQAFALRVGGVRLPCAPAGARSAQRRRRSERSERRLRRNQRCARRSARRAGRSARAGRGRRPAAAWAPVHRTPSLRLVSAKPGATGVRRRRAPAPRFRASRPLPARHHLPACTHALTPQPEALRGRGCGGGRLLPTRSPPPRRRRQPSATYSARAPRCARRPRPRRRASRGWCRRGSGRSVRAAAPPAPSPR